jgi:hypothetical protein
VLLGVLAPGCDAGPRAQDAAKSLAAMTKRVNDDFERFTAQRQAVTAARTANLDEIRRATLEASAAAARPRAVWSADPAAARVTKLMDVVTAYDASAAQAAQREREASAAVDAQLAAALVAKGQKSDQLSASTKALAGLSEPASVKDSAAFLAAFFGEVKTDLDKAAGNAKKAAESAKASADSKTPGAERPVKASN